MISGPPWASKDPPSKEMVNEKNLSRFSWVPWSRRQEHDLAGHIMSTVRKPKTDIKWGQVIKCSPCAVFHFLQQGSAFLRQLRWSPGRTPARQSQTWEELDSILQEKLTFNTFSFYYTRTVEDELLLTKPFQKERHGQVAHKQVAADLLDRCGVLV